MAVNHVKIVDGLSLLMKQPAAHAQEQQQHAAHIIGILQAAQTQPDALMSKDKKGGEVIVQADAIINMDKTDALRVFAALHAVKEQQQPALL